MVGGQVLAYLGGIHYWWSKITGRMYSEFWSKIAAMLVFVGFNLTFFPQFILGYMGMPRRYASYPAEFQVLNIFSTAGASILGIGLLLPVVYLTYSAFFGPRASDNPWLLPGLEWRTSSPPPTENFYETPVVTWEAYDFSEESGLGLGEAKEVNRVV
jgi:cytochrome c oxidase subunit 1